MTEERWVLRYRPTRFSFTLNYFLAAAFLIVLFSLLPFMDLRLAFPKAIFFALLGGIVFLLIEPEVRISSEECALTPESIICYSGLLSKRSVEIPYNEIKNLRIEQNLLDKLIGCGNLLIESDEKKIKIAGINTPEEACKVIEYKIDQIKLAEEKKPMKLTNKLP